MTWWWLNMGVRERLRTTPVTWLSVAANQCFHRFVCYFSILLLLFIQFLLLPCFFWLSFPSGHPLASTAIAGGSPCTQSQINVPKRLWLTQVFTMTQKEKTHLREWIFFFTKPHFSLIMSKLWTCFLKYILTIETSHDSKTIVDSKYSIWSWSPTQRVSYINSMPVRALTLRYFVHT